MVLLRRLSFGCGVFALCVFLAGLLEGGFCRPLAAAAGDKVAQEEALGAALMATLFGRSSDALQAVEKKCGLSPWPFQHVLGKVKAEKPPLVILVYSSLSCHHCADLHLKTVWPLWEKYNRQEAGKVCVVIRDRPLDLYALQATLTSHVHPATLDCHKVFLESQKDWIPETKERAKLKSQDAHSLVNQKIKTLLGKKGLLAGKNLPSVPYGVLQKVSQKLTQHGEFQKITATPLVYFLLPQGKGYHPPQEVSLSVTEPKAFEAEVEKALIKCGLRRKAS